MTGILFAAVALWGLAGPTECADSEAPLQTMTEYYGAVSGPPGEREWTALRALIMPTARVDAIGINETGMNQYYPQSRDEFLDHLSAYVRHTGFFQQAVEADVRCTSRAAQVWARFESRNSPAGDLIDTGWMSVHLVQDGKRWRVAHLLWHSDPKKLPN